ncbi:MAG: hypothetical protein SFU56_07310 [Capsulimonadales bacterium]|nr:hypothetical protein [Capsulimonadales bacterium]
MTAIESVGQGTRGSAVSVCASFVVPDVLSEESAPVDRGLTIGMKNETGNQGIL